MVLFVLFYAWYGFRSMGNWHFYRKWVWNSRAKLCYNVSDKINVIRVLIREFDSRYIMF